MITKNVWVLALQLYPHSARIRAFIDLEGRDDIHAYVNEHLSRVEHQLRRLCEAVMADLGIDEDGVFLSSSPVPSSEISLPSSFGTALKLLRDVSMIESGEAAALVRSACWTGVHPDLGVWLERFIRDCLALRIPIYPERLVVDELEHRFEFVTGETDLAYGQSPFNHGMAADIVHGALGRDIPAACAELLVSFGRRAARQLGVDIVNDYDGGSSPWWHWRMPAFRRLTAKLDPDQVETWLPVFLRKQAGRPRSGEREMLEAYYAITNEPWRGDATGPARWRPSERLAKADALHWAGEAAAFMRSCGVEPPAIDASHDPDPVEDHPPPDPE